MRNRWGILAVLFTIRLTMAFQFQSVGAVAPLLGSNFGWSLADIGLLIGLYFTPGVAIALPGGAIGRKLGDKTAVLTALLLMLIGSLAMAASNSLSIQIAGRLVAGVGGVLLNVQMAKMIADWFTGKEIATAMAIFVNSWPAGIALSLLTLPAVGIAYGVSAVYLAIALMIGFAIALLVVGYRQPPNAEVSAAPSARLDRHTTLAVIMAGLIWGLFNIGFAMVFSFGPSMLVERGSSIAAAGSTVSIVLWLCTLSGFSGGYLADRTKHPQTIIVVGCILFAVLMLILPRSSAPVLTVIALGLISALPAGPIMSLPAGVLAPAMRAIGMGVFYTVHYTALMLGPFIGGAYSEWSGNAAAAFDFGAVVLLACPVLLWVFNRITAANREIRPGDHVRERR